jgi:hypothetical protein
MVQKSSRPGRQQASKSDRMALFGTFWHDLAPFVTGFGRARREAVGAAG